MNLDLENTDQEPICLPETNLKLGNGFFTRTDESGNQVLKLDKDSVTSVRAGRRVSGFGVATLSAGAAIGWIGYEIPDNTGATVFLYLLGVMLAYFGCISFVDHKVLFETKNGPLAITCNDEKDVVDGFVMTVQNQLN